MAILETHDFAYIKSSDKNNKIVSRDNYVNINSSGDYAKIALIGDSARINLEGYSTKLALGGDWAKVKNSFGYLTKISSVGDSVEIDTSDNSAKISSSGDYAKIESTGANSVICCVGKRSMVKARKGSWITLAEWKDNVPVCVKTEFVDGERIKEDVWYKLVDGEFIEQ